MDSAAWAARLAAESRIFKPDGPGPFPVALILHGCGGKTRFLEAYAQVAVEAGYAAVVVDSLKPRGMSRLDGRLFVCTGVALRGLQRAADVFAMLAWLETQAWADPGRVFLAGWSHGGWTIMDAYGIGADAARATGLADAEPARLPGQVQGVLLVYPYASFPSLTSGRGWGAARPRVYSVIAGRDRVVGHKNPRRALERLRRDGLSVDILELPDATHAFDDDQAGDPRSRYRPDLFDQIRRYFAAALRESRLG